MGTRYQRQCASGHEFTPANTYWQKRRSRGTRAAGTFRRCRTCTLEGNRLWEMYKRRSPKKRRPA